MLFIIIIFTQPIATPYPGKPCDGRENAAACNDTVVAAAAKQYTREKEMTLDTGGLVRQQLYSRLCVCIGLLDAYTRWLMKL